MATQVLSTSLQDGQYYVTERLQELSQEHGFYYNRLEFSNRMSRCLAQVKQKRYLWSDNRQFITVTFNNNYIKACVENDGLSDLENTILHEVAHIIVGGEHHHDYIWKRKFLELGGDGNRTTNSEAYKISKKIYLYECPHCHRVVEYTFKPRVNRACGKCCDKYNNGNYSADYKLEFKGIK